MNNEKLLDELEFLKEGFASTIDKVKEQKVCDELESLKNGFASTIDKLKKDLQRQDKIMLRSDQRQQREYDELQNKLVEIKKLNEEIEETQREVVFTMGAIGESRSKETGNHVRRVATYSYMLATLWGLDEEEAELLRQASPMHDIGKVAIPDSILNKPARLTADEFETMKEHAQLGHEMLAHSSRPLLKAAAIVAHEHHEKWDGSGYPRGLKGDAIHIYGRITAVADVFDALGSSRIYKPAWDDEKIIQFFKDERGRHFDPKLVDLLMHNLDAFYEVRDTYRD